MFLHSKFYILNSRKGQAALSFVFLVGVITLSIGVTVAVLAASFLNSGYGYQTANRAVAVASAGIEDALMLLVRNKDFSSTGYSVTNGDYSATVSVTQNSPSAGKATIMSTATVSFYQRKIQAVVSINSTTTEVSLISWQLVTL